MESLLPSGSDAALRRVARHVGATALRCQDPQALLELLGGQLRALGGALHPAGSAGVALRQGGREVARLCLPGADGAVTDALEDLAALLSPLLDTLDGRAQADRTAALTAWVIQQDDPEVACARVLDWLRDLGAEQVTLVAHPAGPADGLLLPLAGRYRARQALHICPPPDWTAGQRAAAEDAARHLALVLERVAAERRLDTLLRLQRQLDSVPAEELYQPLLDAAVQLVPGAQGGSLLVRGGDSFRFGAVVGYDFGPLRPVTFPWQETRDIWYGLGDAAWRRGVPRVLSRSVVLQDGAGYHRDQQWVDSVLPEVQRLQCVVAVPVLFGDEVYALINLDSFTDPDAFDADAVHVTQAFGSMASLLIHEAQRHAQVQTAARTDALTGLANRRAFNECLEQAVRLSRSGAPLSLLVLDLQGFKRVNDRLGHATGDQALRQVAALLVGLVRGQDRLFRWGGDEFAVLLSGTDARGAWLVGQRITRAMGSVQVQGLPLRATIGAATLRPGGTAESLLHEADQAMYAAKARGESLATADEFPG